MTEQEEQLFAKSFNQGYFLQKYASELLAKILKTENKDSVYIQGLTLGKRQYSKETLIQEQKQITEKQMQQKNKPKQ